MAERITHFTPRPDGRPALYPWDEWLDGSAWRIRRGEDFTVAPESMATQIRNTARDRGGRARARLTPDGEGVEFQFETEEMAA